MKTLTSGVGIITFNGLKYLPEQLDSIVAQTRSVDHIVVSDDRSTDGTWEFLQAWARCAPVRVTLIRNDVQLGLTKNFEQAVSAVDADIIFSCDQDDVWYPNKVELLTGVFETHPDVLLVHTDATLVDAQCHDLGTTLLGELELRNAEREGIRNGNAFKVYCVRNLVTGATAAFHRTLLQLARPLPPIYYHDAWLALMAAASGKVKLLDVPTIKYRQHGGNLVGMKKVSPLTKMRQLWWRINTPNHLSLRLDYMLSSRTELHQRLSTLPAVPSSSLAQAQAALAFAQRRASLPRNPARRVVKVLHSVSIGQYRSFSNEPWSDALRDIVSR